MALKYCSAPMIQWFDSVQWDGENVGTIADALGFSFGVPDSTVESVSTRLKNKCSTEVA